MNRRVAPSVPIVELSVHAIDQASGALALLQQYPSGKGANWVGIVSFG